VENELFKCVMVIADELPSGLAVNAAGVLAITLGRRVESLVGPDVVDGSGQLHAGLINITLPVLKADRDIIKQIRMKASALPDLLVVDLTEPAQTSRTYQDYTKRMAGLPAEELGYLAVALYGNKKAINKLTGNLPLLR